VPECLRVHVISPFSAASSVGQLMGAISGGTLTASSGRL
jgi:hypothetical protein